MESPPKVATRSSRPTDPPRMRQQLAEQLREIRTEPRDADRLQDEAEQLRQVFHAARLTYLAAIKLPLDAVDERHAAWVGMTVAALGYALAADFAVAARLVEPSPRATG